MIVAALFVAASVVYGWGTLSASVPRWLVIYACASLALMCWSWRGKWPPDTLDCVVLSLVGYCVLSLSWSVDWRQGAYSAVNMFSLLCVFLWVRHAPVRHVKYLPEAGGVTVLAILVIEDAFPGDWGGLGNPNFQTEMLLSCLALAMCGVSRARAWLTWTGGVCAMTYLLFWNSSKIEFWVLGCLALFWLASKFGSIAFARGSRRRYSATG